MKLQIKEIIEKGAPLLAKTLLGNYAGVAMALINMAIGNTSGDEENATNILQNDPLAIEKVRATEEANQNMLAGLLGDLKSAREMQNVANTRKWLMAILGIGLVIDVYLMVIINDSELDHVLLVIFGLILGEVKQVYRLYFGYGELNNGKETN